MGGCILLLSEIQKNEQNEKIKLAHLDKEGLMIKNFGDFH